LIICAWPGRKLKTKDYPVQLVNPMDFVKIGPDNFSLFRIVCFQPMGTLKPLFVITDHSTQKHIQTHSTHETSES
jgi:hypothetical protein